MGRAYGGEFWKENGRKLNVSDAQAPSTGKEKSWLPVKVKKQWELGDAKAVIG